MDRIIDMVQEKNFEKLAETLNGKVANKIKERVDTKKKEFVESLKESLERIG